MTSFAALVDSRIHERKLLPYVTSFAEFDTMAFIGLFQERGEALTLKRLIAERFTSVATLGRCVARLRLLGVVLVTRSKVDRRNQNLTLSAAARRDYKHLAALRCP